MQRYLEAGLSLEAIGDLEAKHPSTIGYWVKKHGLRNPRTEIFATRGGLDRDELAAYVADGLSLRQIADALDRSVATVRYWLERHGLETMRAEWRRDPSLKPAVLERDCRRHGRLSFQKTGARGVYRCPRCVTERVSARRRQVKEILVGEAGGECVRCGYRTSMRALGFHHLDPGTKLFDISHSGNTVAIDRLREEAEKCALLCANCHAEAEDGTISTTLLRRRAQAARLREAA